MMSTGEEMSKSRHTGWKLTKCPCFGLQGRAETFTREGFGHLTAIVMKNSVFWDITCCSPLKVNRYFEGTCRFHLQDWRVNKATNQHETGGKRNFTFCWIHAVFFILMLYSTRQNSFLASGVWIFPSKDIIYNYFTIGQSILVPNMIEIDRRFIWIDYGYSDPSWFSCRYE
jgi:hypothetical protein